ncbi:IRK-interacting protein [Rhodamnia argentea]|uniref:IRK-interacting protein n=1 Tax=Rhodamnia argentea TaxID=178133 RepID=A0A8B8NYD1_9MYRT|nr:IRK-interacting protein [Rhodamnia argentea]
MAASTLSQIFGDHNKGQQEVSRQEIQAAIAKAFELRALHAALMQGNSPANLRFAAASPVPNSAASSHLSAQDYPVFTPSYEDDPLPGYPQIPLKGRTMSETWDEIGLGQGSIDGSVLSDYRKENSSSRKGFHSHLASLESHVCPTDDQKSVTGSCANNLAIPKTSPRTDFYKSCRRKSMDDLKSVSSCNRCKPAVITSGPENVTRTNKNSNIVVPLMNPLSSAHSHTKNRGVFLSWLLPRLKKKHKNENSPNRTESEEVSQIFKDLEMVSIEALKKELIEANEHRDAALMEVAEMKSSLGELRQKLEYLETYCEGLKKALRQATQSKESQISDKPGTFPPKGNSANGSEESLMPVSEEVMTEGFLQIVAESRLSVKQFCKTLVGQIEEADSTLMDNLNTLLRPHKLSLNPRNSKAVLYHLEAIINQSLYQDFENCVFQKNGSPKILDPQQDRQAQFASFVALRNLSWNEVLRKGTKYYSEEFSKFCDQKMSCIITTLNWTRPWPEQLLQAFFVAAKCIWLLHLLAFSFSPPIGILRVEDNGSFDPHYMEDVFVDRQRQHSSGRVKIMVMPGFYVRDGVLRCKVLCRYRSGS